MAGPYRQVRADRPVLGKLFFPQGDRAHPCTCTASSCSCSGRIFPSSSGPWGWRGCCSRTTRSSPGFNSITSTGSTFGARRLVVVLLAAASVIGARWLVTAALCGDRGHCRGGVRRGALDPCGSGGRDLRTASRMPARLRLPRFEIRPGSHARITPNAVAAGDNEFVDFAAILSNLRPLAGWTVHNSPSVTDAELDDRAALNDQLAGVDRSSFEANWRSYLENGVVGLVGRNRSLCQPGSRPASPHTIAPAPICPPRSIDSPSDTWASPLAPSHHTSARAGRLFRVDRRGMSGSRS